MAWQFLMRSVVNTQLSYKLHTSSTTCGEQGKLQRLLVNCCWSLLWFCISVRGDFYELSSITACHKYKITTEYNLTWHRTTESYHIDILVDQRGLYFLADWSTGVLVPAYLMSVVWSGQEANLIVNLYSACWKTPCAIFFSNRSNQHNEILAWWHVRVISSGRTHYIIYYRHNFRQQSPSAS